MTRRAVIGGGIAAAGVAALWSAARPPSVRAIEAKNPPRGAFLEVDGIRVHHVLQGPQDGPAVVLIHGASGNLNDMTFDLAPRLAAAGFRVAAFDRPGLGHTPRPHGRDWWRPVEQARLLRRAAAALGLARPVVLGHSWGAAVALAWAAEAPEFPEAAAGVVSVSGATMPWKEEAAGPLTPLITSRLGAALGAAALRVYTLRDGGRDAVGRIFRPQSPPEGYLDWLQGELILRPRSFQANTEDIERLNGALQVQARAYPAIKVPVEILHGDADRITGAWIHGEALAEALPEARLDIVPGVGHMLHHARPERVAAAVERLARG